MREKRIRTAVCLSAAACLLVGGLTVGRAMAYFTAYANTSGGVVMDMGFTEIVPDETVEAVEGGWIKHITVSNTGGYPCFVRVKLLYGEEYTVTSTLGAGWTDGGDGYYYYGTPVPAGGKTESEISAKIDAPKEALKDGMNFNVIVVAECTPVLYNENGEPYADWTNENIIIQEVQGGQPDQPQETTAANEEGE